MAGAGVVLFCGSGTQMRPVSLRRHPGERKDACVHLPNLVQEGFASSGLLSLSPWSGADGIEKALGEHEDIVRGATPHHSNTDARCAVVVTALSLERDAVLTHLKGQRVVSDSDTGMVYTVGKFHTDNVVWKVAVAQVGRGNAMAAVRTSYALSRFRPDVALLVGVAGGVKDVRQGDIVVATKVYNYDSGKAGDQFSPRPDHRNCTPTILQIAQLPATMKDWVNRVEPGAAEYAVRSKIIGEPIASGGSVVASKRSQVYKRIRASYSDAVAVEMEGHGFLTATEPYRHLEALVIRGISDLVTHKRQADAEGWQRIAALNASAFAFEVLAKYAFHVKPTQVVFSSPIPGSRIEQEHPEVLIRLRLSPEEVGRRQEALRKRLSAALGCDPAEVEIVDVATGETVQHDTRSPETQRPSSGDSGGAYG